MTREEIRERERERERERVPMEVDLRKADVGEMKKEENKEAESYGDERGCKEEIVLQMQDYQLEKTKAEMGKVIEENQRLKMYLDRILKDYRALQMQYQDFVRQEPKNTTSASAVYSHQNTKGSQLLSLSLGRSSSTDTKNEETYSLSKRKVDKEEDKAGLALQLLAKFKVPKTTPTESSTNNPSPENSKEEAKKEAREICPPNKFPKAERNGDEEVSPLNLTKKARVSLRVRCDTPAMDDGCRWRKYGQKISKGNPCPKAYYRCAVAPPCPVRKQVQRCTDDMSVLVITYEGTHNHLLPVSATAMASATSAAASMLISGSTTSISGPNSLSADFNGLNNFYFPNSPISSLPLCPTITLDLTSTPSSFSSSSHLYQLQDFTQKHSTTNLDFNSLNSNALPISWIHNYGTQHCSFNFEAQSQENFHQQSLLSQDTIAAATKAITSNPGFQSALAAALTSVIGSGSPQQGIPNNKSSRNVKSEEPFPVLSSFPSAANADKFVPKFLNKSHDRDHFI